MLRTATLQHHLIRDASGACKPCVSLSSFLICDLLGLFRLAAMVRQLAIRAGWTPLQAVRTIWMKDHAYSMVGSYAAAFSDNEARCGARGARPQRSPGLAWLGPEFLTPSSDRGGRLRGLSA